MSPARRARPRDPPAPPPHTGALNGIKKLGWASGISLDVLLTHQNATTAKLKGHHILALRIYTTSSYSRINDPLRQDPPQRPHPFAATTFFIDKAIKMLRAVAASLPNAHTLQVYWRGMKDLGLTMEFLQKGGTEFACLSTSASQEVAVNFAASSLPLVFKFTFRIAFDTPNSVAATRGAEMCE